LGASITLEKEEFSIIISSLQNRIDYLVTILEDDATESFMRSHFIEELKRAQELYDNLFSIGFILFV